MRTVSVVVPCLNEKQHLPVFLDSVLRQQTEGLQIEIIIADGLSTDGTREVLRTYAARDARIRIIDNPQQIVSTGLNAAIRCARGEYVLRMDVHAEYAPDYVANCVRVLEATGADNVGGPARVRATSFRERLFGAAFHARFAVGGSRFHDVNYEGPADTVCFGAWRRTTLERIGLFDETLVRNQDDELNYRLCRSGGRLWQSKSIVSWYVPRGRLSSLAKQYFQYGFWKVAVIRKHGRPASLRHLAPGLFVLTVVALPSAAALLNVSGWREPAFGVLALWCILIVAYVLACAVGAAIERRANALSVTALLPFLFPVYHVSYGVGFLYGLFHAALSGRDQQATRVVTSLSR